MELEHGARKQRKSQRFDLISMGRISVFLGLVAAGLLSVTANFSLANAVLGGSNTAPSTESATPDPTNSPTESSTNQLEAESRARIQALEQEAEQQRGADLEKANQIETEARARIRALQQEAEQQRVADREKDISAWRKAQAANSYQGYRDYIRANPGTPFLKEAFAALYDRVKAINSVTVYTDYIKEFSDAPEHNSVKEVQIKASGLESRFTFRQGKIGERYVPSYSKSQWSSQGYWVNDKYYTESRRDGDVTIGGYSADRIGYTAIYQVFNESNQPYVIRLKLSGTSTKTETNVGTKTWTADNYHFDTSSTMKVAVEKAYLVEAGGDIKDQIVTGESKPSDFAVEFIEIQPVSAVWIGGLRKALEGQGDLKLIDGYLADGRASAWHENLREKFTEAAAKLISVQLTTSKRFDRDFDSPVTASFSNRSGLPVKVTFKPNFGVQGSVSLAAGQNERVTIMARGEDKERLQLEIAAVESIAARPVGQSTETPERYAGGVSVRKVQQQQRETRHADREKALQVAVAAEDSKIKAAKFLLADREKALQVAIAAELSKTNVVKFLRGKATRKLYLLSIGINNYPKPFTLGLANKDARDFAHHFGHAFSRSYSSYSPRLLIDEQANRENILKSLDWLRESVGENDTGIVFVAGHGDVVGSSYAFIPSDSDAFPAKGEVKSSAEFQAWKEANAATRWVPGSAFVRTIESGRGRMLVFVDSAHSGQLVRQLIMTVPDSKENYMVMSSSTGKELSQEDDAWGNGAFTKALIEVVRSEKPSDGVIRPADLCKDVNDRVRSLTKNEQRPVCLIRDSGGPIAIK